MIMTAIVSDSPDELMEEKTIIMLRMQNDMNGRVDQNWIAQNREWYRAIWIECAELMDHYGGWKWWKHSEPDIEQVMLEIVDIWHFGLSLRIASSHDYHTAARTIVAQWCQALSPQSDFHTHVEALASTALREREFAVPQVAALVADIGKSFQDLYRVYVGKNVLNFFRQDHGYRDGAYRKVWAGREDNEHLSEILTILDPDAGDFRDAIYQRLQSRYASVLFNK